MNEIIDVKFKMLWNAPVCVATGDRIASFMHGPEERSTTCVSSGRPQEAHPMRGPKKNALPPFRIG
ncbi:hypothetical protein GGE67_001265 [Rhizobium leucaenae]|uniref:Uncharacterized protein n=1 Tax=Rhizobium leucaenae TaxID=29450 RepID=A0A7W7EIK0_9HYPH|nr:hypothetical protein [Rhizobium leucaenae]MBB4566851.1 hypothetical protein [Rhizobium leucaenae]MBB6300659.1 hypothetical protein [Rhizobium leucaenae]